MFLIRRAFVGFCCMCIIIIGIVGLARAHSVGAGEVRYAADAVAIAISLYGLFGVMYLNYRHLFAFTFFLCIIWMYLIANMIVNLVELHPLDVIEDILLAGMAFFCILVSASLTYGTRELAEHDKEVIRTASGSGNSSDPALTIV